MISVFVCLFVAAHYVNCLKTVMMVVMEFVEGGSLGSHLEKLRVSFITLCVPANIHLPSLPSPSPSPLHPPTHRELRELQLKVFWQIKN